MGNSLNATGSLSFIRKICVCVCDFVFLFVCFQRVSCFLGGRMG